VKELHGLDLGQAMHGAAPKPVVDSEVKVRRVAA
jgi:hypothetical protein